LAALCVFGLLVLPSIASAQGVGSMLDRAAQQLFWALVNTVFGFFVWVSGMILNYTITNFVVGFGAIYIDGGLGYSVNLLWGMVRDIFNLTFIFGLVFIGFKLIFNSGDSSAKRMLGSLILAALLVNFSLFFTKVIIDFSNIAAAQFAAGFLNGTTYDVSGTFMSLFGLGSLWGREMSLPALQNGQGWAYIFLSMILFVIAAFVFFAGAILLAIRFVVLNIYMILSPVMFLGWVFPGFSSTSREYWSGFLQRAFFAPAYMLMIYLANQVLVNYRTATEPGTLGGIYSGNITTATQNLNNTVPFFLVAAIFLIASLIVAQKMGAQGATTAIAVGKRWSGKARQVTTGFAADRVRRGMDAAASSNPENDKKYRTAIALARNTARKSARVANYFGVRDAVDGAAKPWTDMTSATKKRVAAQAARDSEARQKETLAEGFVAQYELDKLNKFNGPLSEDQLDKKAAYEKAVDKMALAVSSMSTKLLEELTDSQVAAVGKYMTGSQVENLMKSDNWTDKQKDNLTKARKAAIQEFLDKSGTVLSAQIAKLSIDQIETMGEDWIARNIASFTNGQMDDLKKSKKFTDFRKTQFSDAKKASTVAVIRAGNPDNLAALFRNEKDVGKLPTEAFTSPQAIPYLNPAGLQEKLKNGGFKPEEQRDVVAAIQQYIDKADTPESKHSAWKKWVDTSTYGAGFGFTINDRQPAQPDSPRIIVEEGYRTRNRN
jgi:hypothetical protein